MIYDRIENLPFYFSHSRWEPFCAMVIAIGKQKTEELQTAHRVEIAGYAVEGSVAHCETFSREAWLPFESHREMIDLHLLLSGNERIDACDISALHAQSEYDVAKDFQVHQSPAVITTQTILAPQTFAVYFPHDGHRPKMAAVEKGELIVKIVFKIPVALWNLSRE